MKKKPPAAYLAAFIAKYTPAIAKLAKAALAKMRRRFPGAYILVYDNYNALAIGFSPTERTADAIFSLALFPRWVSLFFFHGAQLPDPHRRLRGSGKQVRHIILDDAGALDEPVVEVLLALALERAPTPIDRTRKGRIIIKSISATQRPRRPKSR